MIQILFVLCVVAASCSLMGSLLLQRESLMVADAISHTILLGIVIAYYFVGDLSSPWLIVGATLFGVITVVSIELLVKTGRVANDAAIGLVFPFFFAIAVLLISKYYSNVHLDIDMVLLGQVELSPLKRMDVLDVRLPVAFVQGTVVLLLNIGFILLSYQSLKIRLFDRIYAQTIGIRVNLLDFILMTLVSLTAVTSFESIGAILVIALMAAPAMTARLLVTSFPKLLLTSVIIAIVNSCIGYFLGLAVNSSISSMVAVVSFISFILVFIIKNVHLSSPSRTRTSD